MRGQFSNNALLLLYEEGRHLALSSGGPAPSLKRSAFVAYMLPSSSLVPTSQTAFQASLPLSPSKCWSCPCFSPQSSFLLSLNLPLGYLTHSCGFEYHPRLIVMPLPTKAFSWAPDSHIQLDSMWALRSLCFFHFMSPLSYNSSSQSWAWGEWVLGGS